ncbi:hypothetical protein [Phage f2b1]|nr:hypothetical protein [Phage f2b1]
MTGMFRDSIYSNIKDLTPEIIQDIKHIQSIIDSIKEGNISDLTSSLSGYTYSTVVDWLNDVEKRQLESATNVMSKKYMASGSTGVYSGSIPNGSNIFTMVSSTHDFKVGQGIAVRTTDGTKQVETLKILTGATSNGTITVKLDGATLQVGVASGDTAVQIAAKIRTVATDGDGSPISQKLEGSGWSTDTGTTDTVTFSHSAQGAKTPMTFTGASGVTAMATVTTTGVPTSSFVSKITEINGNKFTLRDTYSGTSVVNKRVDHDDTEAINNAIMDTFNAGGGLVFIPAARYQVTQIKLKKGVVLTGAGWKSTLFQRGNSNTDVITFDTPNEEWAEVRNLSINGNKIGQTSGGGINFDNSGGSGFAFYDPVIKVDNVLIMNTKGDGFTLGGTREARVTTTFVYGADGNGFYVTATDCFFGLSTAANTGLHGWRLNTPNTRFATCKAYGNGRIDSSGNGDGFFVTGHRHNFTNCEVQDAGRHGFHLYGGSNNIVEGLMCDSNGNRYSGSSAGIQIANGAANNRIEGHALNRTGYVYQKYGLSVNTDCTGNIIHLVAQRNNNIAGEIYPNQGAGNTIVINNLLGLQTPAFTASYTPEIYAGGIISMTLTGNTTINNTAAGHFHIGAKMQLILKQDTTGGRTVTFGNLYKVNWTPDTAASKTNVIDLLFDGTNWIQTATQVGL